MKHLISILLLACCFFAKSQQPFLKFNHIKVEDGLSHEDINVIIQDEPGFMWFGTADGLNRYDGYHIRTYKHDENDFTSLSSNWIWALHVDKAGRLWVGTRQGLNLYNKKTDAFERIKFDSASTSRNDFNINSITSIDSNQLWIGTWGDGLIKYNHKTKDSRQFRNDPSDPNSLSSDKAGCVIFDKDDNLWIGTWYGINRLRKDLTFERYNRKDGIAGDKTIVMHPDPKGGVWAGTSMNGMTYINPARNTINKYSNSKANPQSLGGNVVTALTIDNQGQLWIGTYLNGLNFFNAKSNTFEKFIHDPLDQYSLMSDYVQSLYVDRGGAIWIGSQGVSVLNQFNNRFLHLRVKSNGKGLINNSVWELEEDNKGMVWIGTENGLTRYNPVNGQTNSWQSSFFKIIYSIAFDGDEKLWLGTEKPLLAYFDLKTETFKRVQPLPAEDTPPLSDDINTILKIDNFLYIGTYQKGAFRYNLADNNLKSLNQLYNFNAVNFSTFISDKSQNLWLGTIGDGVIKINSKNNRIQFFKSVQDDSNSLSDNIIYSLFLDEKENLWVGTSNGLNKIEKGSERVKVYNTAQGLTNEAICGVVSDLNNNIWVSTYKGISKLDTKTNLFSNFDHKHGLQGNNFNENAQFIDSKGNIYFGGKNGLTVFHPDEIVERTYKPNLVFTSIVVNNKKQDKLLQEKQIILPSTKNFITIGFSSLDFAIPEKNRYTYMLEGVDETWRETKNPYVNYTDLSHGEYIFKIRGTNSGGYLLSDTRSLAIKILPPWYLSWWAVSFYIAMAIAMFIYFFLFLKTA